MIRRYNYRHGDGGFTDLCDAHAERLARIVWESHSNKAETCDICAEEAKAEPIVELTRFELYTLLMADRGIASVHESIVTKSHDKLVSLGLLSEEPREDWVMWHRYEITDAGRERLRLACRGTR